MGSWHVLGWTHLLAGELDAAEAVLQHALGLDRNFAESHGGLAAIAALRGRHAEAERGIETALRLNPGCLSAQFARSVLTSHAGDPAEARRIIRDTAARLSPDDGSVLSRLIQRATRL